MCQKFNLVGSLLRPENLLEYKRKIEIREDINYPFYEDFPGYQEVESDAIKQIVLEQVEHGVDVVSDGEFSKSVWHLDFLWGLTGAQRYIVDKALAFKDKDGSTAFETRKDSGIRIVEKLSGKNHHFLNIFKQIKENAGDAETKICIPSPSHVYFDFIWSPNFDYSLIYPNQDALKIDLLSAYKDFISEYAAIGGKIIQLDDCRWAMFADDNEASPLKKESKTEKLILAQEFIDYNNELISFAKELGLKVWTHNCRGNYRSRHLSTGSYEKIADLFLGGQNYDRFFLEWDDDRAGSLDALKVFTNSNAEVVLGLLSSKTSTLDDDNRIISALNKAATIIPKDRLYLSHQCGFASTDHGNELSTDQQWAKIKQGQDIARTYFGQ